MEEEKNSQNDKKPVKPATVKYATYIYAALAICVLTVLAVSIFSTAYDPSDGISVTLPEISIPKVIETPDTSRADKPVTGEKSGVPADVEEPPTAEPSYCRPVDGKIIKGYAVTKLVFSETMKDYRTHSGVDIAAPTGSSVRAYSDGTVLSVTDDPLMGKCVTISHAEGLTSVYKNLGTTVPEGIKAGAAVKAGNVIGSVGETSKIEAADESHLHFELLLDGKAIDAEKELKAIG